MKEIHFLPLAILLVFFVLFPELYAEEGSSPVTTAVKKTAVTDQRVSRIPSVSEHSKDFKLQNSPAVSASIAVGYNWRSNIEKLSEERRKLLSLLEKSRTKLERFKPLMEGRADLDGDGVVNDHEYKQLAEKMEAIRPQSVQTSHLPKSVEMSAEREKLEKMRKTIKFTDMKPQNGAGSWSKETADSAKANS